MLLALVAVMGLSACKKEKADTGIRYEVHVEPAGANIKYLDNGKPRTDTINTSDWTYSFEFDSITLVSLQVEAINHNAIVSVAIYNYGTEICSDIDTANASCGLITSKL